MARDVDFNPELLAELLRDYEQDRGKPLWLTLVRADTWEFLIRTALNGLRAEWLAVHHKDADDDGREWVWIVSDCPNYKDKRKAKELPSAAPGLVMMWTGMHGREAFELSAGWRRCVERLATMMPFGVQGDGYGDDGVAAPV